MSCLLLGFCWGANQSPPDTVFAFDPFHSSLLSCDLIVDAGPDTNVCAPGGSIGLMGSVTGNVISYAWTPATGLSNPLSLTPTANITGPITYILTAWGIDPNNPNLIVNGDFEAGNTGFISEYTYVVDIPGDQMEMYPEGTYTVIPNPNLVHNGFSACQDHTGGGNMMVINGAANLQDIWCQTISISPNTYYNVSAWVASVNPASPAILRFSVNGVPLGNIVNAPSATCQWVPFNAFWYSGTNTTAEICILNLNTALGGNDFALDDIAMVSLCSVEDEVEITLYDEVAPDPLFNGPAFLCEGETGTYTALFPPDPPILTYSWTISSGGIILSGQGTPEVTVQWNNVQDGLLCLDIETRCDVNQGCFDVTIGSEPGLPQISGPGSFCPGEIITLYTPEQAPDDLYDWDVPNGLIVTGGEGTNEIEIEWDEPGEYEICLLVTNTCGTSDNCTYLTAYPAYLTLFDTTICEGTTIEINGNMYGNGILTGTEIMTSVQGCDSIVEVTIMEADALEFLTMVSLCPGDSVYAGGAFQSLEGIYIDSFTTTGGCDSLVITEIIITPFDTTWLFGTTCDPATAGITITTIDLGLCDSTVVEEITYIPPDTTLYILFSCHPADSGYVIQTLANQYGCDSIVSTYTSLLLSDTTHLFDTSCDPANIGVFTSGYQNADGCDSTVITTVDYLASDTTLLIQWVCAIADTGAVMTLLANSQGCDSLVIRHFLFGGSDTTFIQASSCSAADTGWAITPFINRYGCDSIIAVFTSLLLSDTTYVLETSCLSADTGIVTTLLTNANGCDSMVVTTTSLLPPDVCAVEAFITVVPPACYNDSARVTLNILTGLGPFELHWANQDIVGSFDIASKGIYTFPFELPGETRIRLVSANGLIWQDTLYIEFPPPLTMTLQSAFDFNGFDIRCFGESTGGAWIDVLSEGSPPLDILWSNGMTSLQADQLPAGTYVVTVTDSHGCIVQDSITLRAPEELTYAIDVQDIRCAGEPTGSIHITSAQGGVEPWMLSLNGQPFTNSWFQDGLLAGIYDLVIMDENGCSRQESITLTELPSWSIHLGPDTSVAYGGLLNLAATVFGTPVGGLMVTWSDGLCPNCVSRQIEVLSDQTLRVTATDQNGCIYVDEILIDVHIHRNVFIPNIFSPNGDQINDAFLIQSGPFLERIEQLSIWDRWGNLVFFSHDFPPGDPLYAWDGKKKGKPLNPGVFAYRVELRYEDGIRQVLYGDVTLVR